MLTSQSTYSPGIRLLNSIEWPFWLLVVPSRCPLGPSSVKSNERLGVEPPSLLFTRTTPGGVTHSRAEADRFSMVAVLLTGNSLLAGLHGGALFGGEPAKLPSVVAR